MVGCRLGDDLEPPERALAGQRPSGLRSRAVRDVLTGGWDHHLCVEDLRRNCGDRDILAGLPQMIGTRLPEYGR